jgi:hypothetical protein
MFGTILKYRTVFIILGFAILIAAVILLITLTNKKADEIPLRGIFVKEVQTIREKEAVA